MHVISTEQTCQSLTYKISKLRTTLFALLNHYNGSINLYFCKTYMCKTYLKSSIGLAFEEQQSTLKPLAGHKPITFVAKIPPLENLDSLKIQNGLCAGSVHFLSYNKMIPI